MKIVVAVVEAAAPILLILLLRRLAPVIPWQFIIMPAWLVYFWWKYAGRNGQQSRD